MTRKPPAVPAKSSAPPPVGAQHKKPKGYPRRARAVRVAPASAPPSGPQWEERLARLVGDFGNNRIASLLDVSPSQPSRWRRGQERMSADSQRRLLDLDYVMARLLQLYPREQAEIWLGSHNAHLGARPVDVLRLQGAGPVVAAVDAEAEGAYA